MHFDLLISADSPAGLTSALDAALRRQSVGVVLSATPQQSVPTGDDGVRYLQRAVIQLVRRFAEHPGGVPFERVRAMALRQWRREQRYQLERLQQMDITFFSGQFKQLSPHTVEITDRQTSHIVGASRIVGLGPTATPRKARIADDLPRKSLLSDYWNLPADCRRLVIAGNSILAIELASLFLQLGMHVDLIADVPEMLIHWDSEITDTLMVSLQTCGCRFISNARVESADVSRDGVDVRLSDGQEIRADALLADMQTDQELLRICSSATAQSTESRGIDDRSEDSERQHHEIRSVPSAAMAGATEEQLIADDVQFESGTAVVSTEPGVDDPGRLKLLFHRESRRLLGVHCIGEHAAQFVQLGCVVMEFGGTLDYIRQSVFSDSAAEPFRVAASDALRKLGSYHDRPVLHLFDPQHESPRVNVHGSRYPTSPSLV